MTNKNDSRLIETDHFPFEFLSEVAERESWRKEVYRPVYHVHKWWAKRLGSVFRGALLGSALPVTSDLKEAFYRDHEFTGLTVFDPFMGSGTTLGEAHKLGFTALGRDINPVAVQAVKVGLGALDRNLLQNAFDNLRLDVGSKILGVYRSTDANRQPCDVLYYFWVMQAPCPACENRVDLFSSYVLARNAYPHRKPEVQVLCRSCGHIFQSLNGHRPVACPRCQENFDPDMGPAAGAKAICNHCGKNFSILEALHGSRPDFRMYGKLILTRDGRKEYLATTPEDCASYTECSHRLRDELNSLRIVIPALELRNGYNTKQAMKYGFVKWRDFFNDRQLLSLGLLLAGILKMPEDSTRNALLTLFSGVLEFNNMFASYKGEGTGAVRHMFAHHILKPERTPIEANVWGTSKSSGSFSGLFRSRILRAADYHKAPIEVNGRFGKGVVCSKPFSGKVHSGWPTSGSLSQRGIYLSCGDSARTQLPARSQDLVVTDPPFFDNVHYSELADFFFAWQQLVDKVPTHVTTRSDAEVQDPDGLKFSQKLKNVLSECHRILKDDGLLVFTYHHSRDDGWKALAEAITGAGFVVVNSHPVKSEMSVAAPKSQAKEPIQLDILLVCRKKESSAVTLSLVEALRSGKQKLERLRKSRLTLSHNDCRVVLFGQMLAALDASRTFDEIVRRVDAELATERLYQAPLFHAQHQ